MVVSEKGCRAVYTAQHKVRCRSKASRVTEACLYRESCSGRIAAMIHNNPRLFSSRNFTIVSHERFRGCSDADTVEALHEIQVVFNSDNSSRQDHNVLRSDCDNAIPTMGSSLTPTRSKSIVDAVLDKVLQLTFLQSEDPVWFLLRAFKFTSRTSHNFLVAVASDYDKFMLALSDLEKGQSVCEGGDALPDSVEEALSDVNFKWDVILDLIGIQKRVAPATADPLDLKTKILGMTNRDIASSTKPVLTNLLNQAGRRQFPARNPSRPSKEELVSALQALQKDILEGRHEIGNVAEGSDGVQMPTSQSTAMKVSVSHLQKKLREASLNAWVMKPLVSTSGMREGSWNEIHVIKALPSFFKNNTGAVVAKEKASTEAGVSCDSTGFVMDPLQRINVKYIRTLGLVSSKSCPILGDSPDAVCSATDRHGNYFCFAVEVKTMTAAKTIESAHKIAADFGEVTIVSDIGTSQKSDERFRKLVPSSAYRAQCLHHAAVLGLSSVLYAVGTGGGATTGRVIYAALLQFSTIIRHMYTFTLDCVFTASFKWIGKAASEIPQEYDDLLKSSHASDLFSLALYYNLSQAILKTVNLRSVPIAPCRMVRLSTAVYWNYLNGGVDIVSRILKTLARSNMSEHPAVGIIARLLVMQVNNAAVIYRLYCAKQQNKLPNSVVESGGKGYSYARHRVSQCESFGRFARMLAKEWVAAQQSTDDVNGRMENDLSMPVRMEPMFQRNAADRYNLGVNKDRRLLLSAGHVKVKAQAAYCSLCSYAIQVKHNGKTFTKKKGSKQSHWCTICRQAICSSCWNIWHSEPTLKRSRATTPEEQEFARLVKRQKRTRVRAI